MWNELKTDPNVTVYFPTYSKSRLPNKKYLLNVVNTIKPGSIISAIKKITKIRSQQ